MSLFHCDVQRRPDCPIFKLRFEVALPASRADVFQFFSDARNLDQITPPFLRFRVLTPGMIDMRVGTRIDYSLRVHGLPLRWTSEITAWDPPRSFVDVQVRGPYRWWHHLHQFDEVEGSTKATDEVEYACPGGRIVNALFVERDLRRIFQYRLEFLKTRFSGNLGKSIDSGLGRS